MILTLRKRLLEACWSGYTKCDKRLANVAGCSQMLKEYGVESGIKDSSAEVKFDISWPNAPMDFGFEALNGDVEWSLSDGYLTELSDQGSRIFTLFSLNSLVRKLSLDFRDVFAKGFFYDDMGGTLKVVNGKAYTDDTEIDGGAGELK